MSDRKRNRKLQKLIQDEGVEIIEMGRGGKHLYARLLRKDGAEKTFHFSVTPSDWRADLQKRSAIRRWAKARRAPLSRKERGHKNQ